MDQQSSLDAAFEVLCSTYADDPLQVSICARVLAFHFLMESTAGAVVEDWVQPHPETPQLVILHPAVVEAVATLPLRGTVLLTAAYFHQILVETAGASTRAQSSAKAQIQPLYPE